MWAYWACLETGTGTNSSNNSDIRGYAKNEAENNAKNCWLYCSIQKRRLWGARPASALAISIVCDETATSQRELAIRSGPSAESGNRDYILSPDPVYNFLLQVQGSKKSRPQRSCVVVPSNPPPRTRDCRPRVFTLIASWVLGCDRVHDSESINAGGGEELQQLHLDRHAETSVIACGYKERTYAHADNTPTVNDQCRHEVTQCADPVDRSKNATEN